MIAPLTLKVNQLTSLALDSSFLHLGEPSLDPALVWVLTVNRNESETYIYVNATFLDPFYRIMSKIIKLSDFFDFLSFTVNLLQLFSLTHTQDVIICFSVDLSKQSCINNF